MALKLIVGNRNRKNTKKELIHKRPRSSILKSKLVKSKYIKFLGDTSFFQYHSYTVIFFSFNRSIKKEETKS